MQLDLKRIDDRIQFIKENLGILRELSGLSEAEFVGDKFKFYAANHALQISIEAMLDIFSHVIARLHHGAPSNDRELLEIALKKGLTSEDHFRRFAAMNKFRNKIVHGYLDIDAKQVYGMLQTDLGDFDLFFADIHRIVGQEKATGKIVKRKNSNSRK